ncbi:mannosyl-glycoprotein endo-beta-N-acetylglucosamidase [Paenibacillus faecis]|uniref:Mannosyl-glycoprotein endo-beta-N-acetylglucosamidase n=1 Tax=Paenibacillus faecis TaxID=862114 RepID=A0A5D0CWS8_9BACL|nr:glucosaminidase domain-containing protein [Paenibacillus faecis]TYA14406.1 mannosyl-glycoprotein endo-beta-N-acetylglucosamidase [Paenibacillus faecis]
MDRAEFIAAIAPDAVKDWHQSGVPASLTIAQAALESNWGSSGLARQANNLFGIKGNGPAGSVMMPTTEYRNGSPIRIHAPFRKYRSWAESIADHTRLLQNKRYAGVLRRSGQEAAKAVAAAGYATDPSYASKLIGLMDKYNLYQYDTRKGDEPMTAEEKKRFDALLDTVNMQAERIAELERKASMPVPDWAKAAVQAAVSYDLARPLIDTPEGGSLDFYRVITILHRRGLFDKKE